MNCENFLSRLSEYLQNELSPEEMSDMKNHAQNCSFCRKELKMFTESYEYLRGGREFQLSPDFMNKLKRAVSEEKNSFGFTFRRLLHNRSFVAVSAAVLIFFTVLIALQFRPPSENRNIVSPAPEMKKARVQKREDIVREPIPDKKTENASPVSESMTPTPEMEENNITIASAHDDETHLIRESPMKEDQTEKIIINSEPTENFYHNQRSYVIDGVRKTFSTRGKVLSPGKLENPKLEYKVQFFAPDRSFLADAKVTLKSVNSHSGPLALFNDTFPLDEGMTIDENGKVNVVSFDGGTRHLLEISGDKIPDTRFLIRHNNLVEDGLLQKSMVLKEGSPLEGKVVDVESNPVSGADVTLFFHGNPSESIKGFSPEKIIKTDEKGKFVLKDIVPNKYNLLIEKEGFAPALEKFDIPREEKIQIALHKQELCQLSGTVTDSEGLPVTGALVKIAYSEYIYKNTYTDENGLYHFENLPPGRTFLAAVSPLIDMPYIKLFHLPEGEKYVTLDYTFEKTAEKIKGKIFNVITEEPLPGVKIHIKGMPEPVSISDSEGAWELNHRITPDMRLVFEKPGFETVKGYEDMPGFLLQDGEDYMIIYNMGMVPVRDQESPNAE